MERKLLSVGGVGITFGGLALVAVLGVGGFYVYSLQQRVAELESSLNSTTALLVGTLEETQANLSETLTLQKEEIENRLGSVAERVEDVSGTVGNLEKLAQTDPELLTKYSKVYFLNENYAPERVSNIATEYLYNEANPEVIHAQVWPYLRRMLRDAVNDDVELYVLSAYRSFDEQKALKGAYTVTYGAGTANQFSADQGYSEHQLGTAVDLITPGLGGQLTSAFESTDAFRWLEDHAHEYGFILSYPKNNGYYVYEPWHWRFVGVDLATDLHEDGEHFYDLNQRDIDEYLIKIFD